MNMTIKEFADMLKRDIELLSNSTIPLKEDYKRGFLAGLDHALSRANWPELEEIDDQDTCFCGLKQDGHDHVEL